MPFHVAVSLLLVILVHGSSASAQADPVQVRHRNSCRLAGQVLETGYPAKKRDWARNYVIGCPNEGPAYLVTLWDAPPADTIGLRDLAFRTARYRDRRTYEKVRAIARNPAEPDRVRVSAMIVLARMVDRRIAIELWDLRYREYPGGRVRMLSNSAVHAVQNDGAQILGNVDNEVLMLLQRIAADREREPQAVWFGAAVLARRVEWHITNQRAGEH